MKKILIGGLFYLVSMGSFAGPILDAGDSALFEFDLGYEPGFYSQWVFVSGLINFERPFDYGITSWEFFSDLDGEVPWHTPGYVGALAFGAFYEFGDGAMSVRITMGEGSGIGSTTSEVSPYLVERWTQSKTPYSAVTVTRAAAEVPTSATIGLLGLGLAGLGWSRRKKA